MSEVDQAELAEARIGRVLSDKWTLEALLGVGGMAAVYSARHRNGARAAVKVLHPALALHANVRERFLHEGYAANRVEHPDVVKVLDDDVVQGGPDDGAAFLVMELLEGRSLEDRIQQGPPVGEEELLEIVLGVLGVLEAAHARGIVHRDLKPENLFLVAGEETTHVKVLDFGIARTIESRGMTVHGVPMGTPAFMAPEQASGRVDEIDGRTDLFALGATAFNVLSGQLVHEGESTIDVMGKTANEQARSVRTVAPKVSEATARLIDKALMLNLEDRYPDAKAMRVDVEAALRELREGKTGGTKTPSEAPTGDSPVVERRDAPLDEERSSGCASRLLLITFIATCGTIAWFVGGKQLWEERQHVPAASASIDPNMPDTSPVPVVDAAIVSIPEVIVDASVVWDAEAEDAQSDDDDEDAGSTDVDATPPRSGSDATAPAVSVIRPPTHPSAHPSSKPKPKPKHH